MRATVVYRAFSPQRDLELRVCTFRDVCIVVLRTSCSSCRPSYTTLPCNYIALHCAACPVAVKMYPPASINTTAVKPQVR
jgi:hypothetical protein